MACESCFSGFQWTPYNDGTGRCFRTVTTPWVFPSSPISLVNSQNVAYSVAGSKIYTTYNLNGTSIGSTTILTSVPLWDNGGLSTQGPLNRSGKWTNLSAGTTQIPTNVWVGFSTCVDVGSIGKTFYLGIAGDNDFRFSLDGVEIVNTYNGPYDNTTTAFNYWHIYPVNIGAGNHTIEVFGLNRGSIAGFGCEIYDNTFSQLTAATTYGDLNVIFTTESLVSASTFQTLTGQYISSGITCPQGGVVSPCSGGCIQYIVCEPTTLTPTPTPTVTPTPTITPTPSLVPKSIYLSGCCDNQVYKSQSLNNYIIGETVRLSPNNFCYRVIEEPKIPPSTTINDTLGFQYVSGCLDKSCQPCPTTAYTYTNSCKVLTILDFFYECNTTDPSSYGISDGVLSVIVTGGTPPYTITWTDSDGNIYNGKTITNVVSGTYHVKVVDYWGDFSGETDCVIVGPKDCDFSGSIFEYIKPCIGCADIGYVLWNDLCIGQPIESISGSTLNIVTGDQGGSPDRGTFFYSEITNLPKPLTFVNYAQINTSTSAVTITNGQASLLVDGTNYSQVNSSPTSQFLGTYDSNFSGTAVPISVTGTTNIWKYNGGGSPYQTLFMKDAIKYNTGANQWVDLTYCLTATTDQLFHFFLAADDIFRLKIDDEWIVYRQNINFNPVPVGCPPSCPPENSMAADGIIDRRSSVAAITISYNHVLPITLSAGVHIIQFGFADIFNYNVLSCCTTSTMVIFSGISTAALSAISNYNSLSAYTVFSTKQFIGTTQTVYTEEGGDFGYYCPVGSTLTNLCDTPYCVKQPIKIPCVDAITQTPTPTPTLTPTPTITPTITTTPTPTPTSASTSIQCALFEFVGGTYSFTNCYGTYLPNFFVEIGDTVQQCVQLPYQSNGATFLQYTNCDSNNPPLNSGLFYYVRVGSGCKLQIVKGTTTLLNQVSSFNQEYTGYFTSPNPETYVITGKWESGSSNHISMRICKGSTSEYYWSTVGLGPSGEHTITVYPNEIYTVEIIAQNGLLQACGTLP